MFFLREGVGRLCVQFCNDFPGQAETCREAGEGDFVSQLCFQIHQLQQFASLILGPVRLELAVEKILVLVKLLPHLHPLSPAADLCQKSVFLHNSQYCLRIAVNTFALSHSHIRR